MITVILTEEQARFLADAVEDVVDDWSETGGDIERDYGADSDELKEHEGNISKLGEALAVLTAALQD